MNEEEYRSNFDSLKSQLNNARRETLEEMRKKDSRVIKANADYSDLSAQLARNYGMAIRGGGAGNITLETYQEQLDELKKDLAEKENVLIREGTNNVKDELLQDYFEDHPDRQEQAEIEIRNHPEMQWLKEPGEEVPQTLEEDKNITSNEFEQNAGNAIPPAKTEFAEKTGVDNDAENKKVDISSHNNLPPHNQETEIDNGTLNEIPSQNDEPEIEHDRPNETLRVEESGKGSLPAGIRGFENAKQESYNKEDEYKISSKFLTNETPDIQEEEITENPDRNIFPTFGEEPIDVPEIEVYDFDPDEFAPRREIDDYTPAFDESFYKDIYHGTDADYGDYSSSDTLADPGGDVSDGPDVGGPDVD